MRIDYANRRNGTHGFVHTLPVRRAPELTRNLAYTANRISTKAPWKSEFAAATDVKLSDRIPLHRFVRDALRDSFRGVGGEAQAPDAITWCSKRWREGRGSTFQSRG